MTAPDTFGPKPELAWLPVADLAVDPSYQRSVETRRSQAAIEGIAEHFRWALFGTVTVTKGLVGYLIIDGQHRVEAARRRKIVSVPCIAIGTASVREQAMAFVDANRRRLTVGPFAIYHAMVHAGDEDANALLEH